MPSIDFILERAVNTRNAQDEIKALWTWDERTVAEWDTAIAAVRTQQDVVADANAAMLAKRGELDAALDELHEWTVEVAGMARVHWRKQPEKMAIVATFSARGAGRPAILEEAQNLESGWEELDPDWASSPNKPLTPFKALRARCQRLFDGYSRAQQHWREQAEKLNVLAAELEEVNEAWYQAACLIFREGTAEGDMIRGTVPTTYSPPPTPPEPEPTPPPPPNP